MKIHLPYGRTTLEAEFSSERVVDVIESGLSRCQPEKGAWELVEESLRHPIGSSPLHELARGKRRVVLIASDHTRPVPSKIIVPQMLAEIRRGNPVADITILVATGCHRTTTVQELVAKFGANIVSQEKIVIHDCRKTEDMICLGRLPGGGTLMVNRLAAEADLLVSEGFIEPHFFAGFSGGRKSVLPGIAAQQTVYANHCAQFIDDDCARAGVLEGNPIHRDMLFAARKAGLAFIVNVAMNAAQQVIAAFSGDCEQAHMMGCAFLENLCRLSATPADIVVTTNNGYPLDQNLYQTVKGLCTAEAVVKRDGVIIMVAACEDGCGGESFYRTFAQEPDAEQILQRIREVPAENTVADQWQSQIFARILSKHRVILVTQAPEELVRALHMIPADSVEKALKKADELLGYCGTITVIPDGISCILSQKCERNRLSKNGQ